MAEDFAIGKELEIPKSVLDNIDKIDKKINDISKDSELMAQHFGSAMIRMGNGADVLLKKMQQIQSLVNSFNGTNTVGLNNISNGMLKTATEAERVADSVSKAATAMNKFNNNKNGGYSSYDAERKAYIEKYDMYKRMFDQIERNERKALQASEKEIKAAEKQAKAQERLNKAQEQRTNNNAINAYNRAMASSEALITQRINKIAKLRQAEEMLTKASGNYSTQISKIRSEIERLNKLNEGQVDSYGRIIRSHQNLMNTSDQLMRKLALIFSVSQIQGYLMNLVKVRGEFELQNTALASILQNKDKADKLFAQITELAVKSPFTLKELTTYTKSLSAYQVEYEKLYDTTKMLADVSAGLGVDMQRLILAFGQVKAANVLRGTEVRQFTEAGLNILGELAKYYSELEGKMISVGDVQERVTKKMVAFADVEEVFKRVTSAGGIFYNMQERQAETLAGQMSNLQDSIDIMLNDIGKANDGVIKSIVASVRTIVENWEIFANLINASTIGFVAYTAKVLLAAKANGSFAASSAAGAIQAKGLLGILLKLRTAFAALATFAKNNPLVLIVTAAASAYYVISDQIAKVEEARKEYDRLSNSILTSKKELDKLSDSISKNNTEISTYKSELSSLSKGSDEYKKTQEKLNNSQKEQGKLLNELKAKFPEVYDGLVRQKEGTVDLTEAQKKYNEELEKTRALNILMQQGVGFFEDDIKTDFSQLNKSYEDNKKAIEGVSTALSVLDIEATKAANSSDKLGKGYGEAVLKILSSSDEAEDKLKNIVNLLQGASVSGGIGRELYTVASDALLELSKSSKSLSEDTKEANKELGKIIENILANAKVKTEEQFKSLDENAKKSAIKFAQPFIEEIDVIKNEFIKQFVNDKFKSTLGITFEFDKQNEVALSYLETQIKEFIKDNKLTLVTEPEGKGESDYFDKLRAKYKSLAEDIEVLNKATEQRDEKGSNKEKGKQLEEEKKQIKTLLSAYGEFNELKSEKKGESQALKFLKEQIALIKKAGDEYKKLRKYYNEEDATAQIRESFADAFDNLGLDISMSFDVEGVIKGIKNLQYQIIQGGKKAVDEVVAPLESEKEIKFKEKGLDDIEKRFEAIFSKYKLSVELEGMGVDKKVISNLFDVEIFDLNELKKSIEPLEQELKNFGEKGEKMWSDINKKISEAEKKELEQRMKEFVKYLEKTIDETKRIQSKAAKDISFAKMLFGEGKIDSKQYVEAISQIQKKANEELSKVAVDRFKESPEYIKAMGDMSMYSRKELERLSEQLQKLIADSASFSSASDLKVYQDALNKVNEQIDNIKTPFDESFIGQIRKAKELQNKYNAELERYNRLLNEKAQKESELQNALKTLQSLEDRRDSGDNSQDLLQQISNAQEGIKLATQSLGGVNNQLNISQGKLSSISSSMGGIMQGAQGALGMVDMIIKGVYQSINATIELFNEIKSLAESFGAKTDEGGWSDWSIAMGTLGEMNNKVMGAWESLKSGDIAGSVVQSFGAVFSVIKGINALFDNKREKEIRRQLEMVEQLQISYEKLEKAIDSAFSIDTLKKSTDQTIANLKAQNDALEAARAAEIDKKKTDDARVKEFENQIADNLDRIAELEQDKISKVTAGILDDGLSAADAFVDAWLEAFQETGDGLKGLEDNFNEMLLNLVKRQAAMTLVAPLIENMQKELEKYINKDDTELTISEADRFAKYIKEQLPELSESLENMFESLKDVGLDFSQSGDTMSGLSKSISGITEETADALAAITESIRYFSADSNAVLKQIYNAIAMPNVENPFLMELRQQTSLLTSINSLFSSVIKTSAGKGKVIRMEIA